MISSEVAKSTFPVCRNFFCRIFFQNRKGKCFETVTKKFALLAKTFQQLHQSFLKRARTIKKVLGSFFCEKIFIKFIRTLSMNGTFEKSSRKFCQHSIINVQWRNRNKMLFRLKKASHFVFRR